MAINTEVLTLAVVGAASIMLLRSVDAVKDIYVTGDGAVVDIPIPAIQPKNGFGLEWAIIPAAIAYVL
jgi:hypothetical protein